MAADETEAVSNVPSCRDPAGSDTSSAHEGLELVKVIELAKRLSGFSRQA
jgi:hypothetical protein